MPRTNVVKLFKSQAPRALRTADARTPRQRVTCERNWCYYMLAGMEGLTKAIEVYTGKELGQLRNAITSARYSVDAAWYDKCDEIEAGTYDKRRKSW